MKKIILIVLVIVVAIFAWAPWMKRGQPAEAFVKKFDELGQCDHYISESWRPFGSWIEHCRGSWYTTFWGRVLFYGKPKS